MLTVFRFGTVPIKCLQHDTHNAFVFRPMKALPRYMPSNDEQAAIGIVAEILQ